MARTGPGRGDRLARSRTFRASPALCRVLWLYRILTLCFASSCIGLFCQVVEGVEELRRLTAEKPHISQEFRGPMRCPLGLRGADDRDGRELAIQEDGW